MARAPFSLLPSPFSLLPSPFSLLPSLLPSPFSSLPPLFRIYLTLDRYRAYLGPAGYSVEGCPNSNAYAHSSCGLPIYGDHVLALEFMGLFKIRYFIF